MAAKRLERTASLHPVVALTRRRVRDEKRRAAAKRDKETIISLRWRVEMFQQEVNF